MKIINPITKKPYKEDRGKPKVLFVKGPSTEERFLKMWFLVESVLFTFKQQRRFKELLKAFPLTDYSRMGAYYQTMAWEAVAEEPYSPFHLFNPKRYERFVSQVKKLNRAWNFKKD